MMRFSLYMALGCLTATALLCAACSKDTPDPAAEAWTWSDGFEDAANTAALFPSDGSRWSNVQVVDPESGPNTYWLQQDSVAAGAQALSMRAMPSGATLSKMDFEKQGFWAPEGSTFRAEAQFWFPEGPMPENLLLMDLECCSCWDPTVPDNQCPGVRLMFTPGPGGKDYLSIERGKILGSTLRQDIMRFPRERWVPVVWESDLSTGPEGRNRLWVDGELVLDQGGFNLPVPSAFTDTFALYSIDFELAEPLGYERFQIGATANPSADTAYLILDEVVLSVQP